MNELDLFVAALAIPDPAERAAYLERECQGNLPLRQRLEQLLAASAAAGSFLEQPGPVPAAAMGGSPPNGLPVTQDFGDPTARIGSILGGKYKLIEEIGAGGMGRVYLAQQSEPVKRVVAVKVVKAGMDSAAVLARFEAERQALAMMDHPNIARVLDAGTTEGGRPFFVMELVKGIPITQFCDERRLTPRQRLELFVPVCQAIQHAHQKGIIHRDIKPSNVLVALYDDRAVPKVIDFGLAKAAGQTLTERTLMTGFGTVMGTAEYMSPEQASLNNLDIDTRSDVYSLGVLLYELLTGTTPVDRKSLGKAALLEVLRIVREVEAPRPSLKVSSSAMLASVAANRSTEPSKLSRLMRGELDWLLLRALEKDRSRRYDTANGLARDIQRYLADEVVEARPPSTSYRIAKFVRRNRGRVLAASLVLLALLAGITGTTWGLIRATQQQQRALAAQQEAAKRAEAERQAKLEAEASAELAAKRLLEIKAEKEKADTEKSVAQAVKDFLQNKLLGQADTARQGDALLRMGESSSGVKYNPTIRELLDRAARELAPGRIEASFPKLPVVQAEILHCIGTSYLGIGEYPSAIAILERSQALFREQLGLQHAYTQANLNNLAGAYENVGKTGEAIKLLQEICDIRVKNPGIDNPDTLLYLSNLASSYRNAGRTTEAIKQFEQIIDIIATKFGPSDPRTLTALQGLGTAYRDAGKTQKAIQILSEVLENQIKKLGPDHSATLVTFTKLASTYTMSGNATRAIELLEPLKETIIDKIGPDHPNTLSTLNTLALAYKRAGKTLLAIDLYEKIREVSLKKFGPDHPITLSTVQGLGEAYLRDGKDRQAIQLLEQARDTALQKLGPEHATTINILDILGILLFQTGKPEEAVTLLEQVRTIRGKKLGPDHPDTLTTISNLAMVYQDVNRTKEAIELLEQIRDIWMRNQGLHHPDTQATLHNLARAYKNVGKLSQAIELLETVRDASLKNPGPDHPDTLLTLFSLAMFYVTDKRTEQGIELLDQVYRSQVKHVGADHVDTLNTASNLGSIYQDNGRTREAIPLLEKARQKWKEYPQLLPFGMKLLEAYAKTGERAKCVELQKELLPEARRSLARDGQTLNKILTQLSMTLLEVQAFAEAEPVLREWLALREKIQPDVWSTFNTKSILGGALLSQKKYREAETILLAGYEGMKQREKMIPPAASTRIPEALDRLIKLYSATNKPEEVKKWQAERAKYPPADPKPADKK